MLEHRGIDVWVSVMCVAALVGRLIVAFKIKTINIGNYF